jgi:hypothetical protein
LKHDSRSSRVDNSPHRLYAATSGFQCGRLLRRCGKLFVERCLNKKAERFPKGLFSSFVCDADDNHGATSSSSSSSNPLFLIGNV